MWDERVELLRFEIVWITGDGRMTTIGVLVVEWVVVEVDVVVVVDVVVEVDVVVKVDGIV